MTEFGAASKSSQHPRHFTVYNQAAFIYPELCIKLIANLGLQKNPGLEDIADG
jgi:hypothetical protein